VSRAHKPKAGFWIRLSVLLIYPTCSLLFRIRWRNLDRIPPTGGVLLVSNHISEADTLTMARLVWQAGRIPRFLIKSTVFDWPLVGRVVTGARQIPVHRGTRHARSSLEAASRALRDGECVIIYPEGTITQQPDYWPVAGKTGVARIILENPTVPVIPVAQWGAQRTLGRRGRLRPVPFRRHEASIGKPLDLSGVAASGRKGDQLTDLTALVMAAITDELATLRPDDPRPQD
jgi:1-acyl-sn-glycerol-3-phosphate acyltransferase